MILLRFCLLAFLLGAVSRLSEARPEKRATFDGEKVLSAVPEDEAQLAALQVHCLAFVKFSHQMDLEILCHYVKGQQGSAKKRGILKRSVRKTKRETSRPKARGGQRYPCPALTFP